MRGRLALIAILLLGAIGLLGSGYRNARSDPIVRRATVQLPRWPAGAAPVRAALISDIHLGGAAMDAARLSRIVDRINRLSPDLILIAGDFVYGDDPAAAASYAQASVAPLSRLRAPLGVIATRGNHDVGAMWPAIGPALAQAQIVVLENEAIGRGPLAIGGLGDVTSGLADVPRTMTALRRLPGARVMLTHAPIWLPQGTPLLLAGHTHCGQIVLPLVGAVGVTVNQRYLCGLVRFAKRTTIVTGGLGTSGAPIRIGAPPDLWLLTLEGSR